MTTLAHNQSKQSGTAMLAVGLVVSLGVHAIVGSVAVLSAQSHAEQASPGELVIEPAEPPALPEPDLGIKESRIASIAWLGVEDREQEGAADPSVVEQAALSESPGDSNAPSEPVQVSPTDPSEATPAQQPSEPAQEQPAEPETPAPVPEITTSPQPEVVVVEPAPPEEEPDPPQDGERASEDAPVGPELVSGSKQPPAEVRTESPPQPQPEPISAAGLPGEQAQREAVATAIRDAEDVLYDRMHRPLSAHGLEIQPRAPRYPLSVQNASIPSNAVVLIRFGRDGKVRSADFLVSADGKKRYDTGRVEINAPLMAAIYQWTAKGKRLLELDPDDPDAVIEIPMRILFSKPRYED